MLALRRLQKNHQRLQGSGRAHTHKVHVYSNKKKIQTQSHAHFQQKTSSVYPMDAAMNAGQGSQGLTLSQTQDPETSSTPRVFSWSRERQHDRGGAPPKKLLASQGAHNQAASHINTRMDGHGVQRPSIAKYHCSQARTGPYRVAQSAVDGEPDSSERYSAQNALHNQQISKISGLIDRHHLLRLPKGSQYYELSPGYHGEEAQADRYREGTGNCQESPQA